MRRLFALALVACSQAALPSDGGTLDAAMDAGDSGAADADAAPPPCPSPTTFDPKGAPEITVAGDSPAMGIFDPSLVGSKVMAYSAVPDQETIRTHIATSADQGATWTFVVEANVPEPAMIASSDKKECPTGTCSGNLISEVTTLVDDADEPDASKRWKLFAHRYLVGPGVALHYRIGTIALQTAPDPAGPWTLPSKLIGWTSPSTYTTDGIATNIDSLAGTSDCLVLTEPGALWRANGIDLAVGCVYLDAGSPAIRIELLRSTDHAASWQPQGTLLRPSDAACVSGAKGVNAADLFAAGGQEWLVATPGMADGTYGGCLVFPLPIPRDRTGMAIASRVMQPAPLQFAGACTFAEGVGYAMDVGFLSDQRKFRIERPGPTTP